ncbi:hypothetical protein BC940DRAFT_357354, partial [Gongronella butleri]
KKKPDSRHLKGTNGRFYPILSKTCFTFYRKLTPENMGMPKLEDDHVSFMIRKRPLRTKKKKRHEIVGFYQKIKKGTAMCAVLCAQSMLASLVFIVSVAIGLIFVGADAFTVVVVAVLVIFIVGLIVCALTSMDVALSVIVGTQRAGLLAIGGLHG